MLLVLAVDVSSSIDPEEAHLQREGYLVALTDPEILAQVRRGANGAIGLAYVERAGIDHQRLVLPWTRITSLSDAETWAQALVRSSIGSGGGTSIEKGINFARHVLDLAPWPAARRIIDVSGDGMNNGAALVEAARDRIVAEGITINGIAIEGAEPVDGGVAPPDRLEDYYRDTVIGGPGAFAMSAEDFTSFGTAIRRKLGQEIT